MHEYAELNTNLKIESNRVSGTKRSSDWVYVWESFSYKVKISNLRTVGTAPVLIGCCEELVLMTTLSDQLRFLVEEGNVTTIKSIGTSSNPSHCNLCLSEKLCILSARDISLLNKKSELVLISLSHSFGCTCIMHDRRLHVTRQMQSWTQADTEFDTENDLDLFDFRL